MIKIIDKEFKLFDEFKSFCKRDSFGTRIYSHFLCYGYEYNFIDFWVQIVDETVVSVMCRLDGDFVVCACKNTDFSELSAFLNFQNKLSVTFDFCYKNDIVIDCITDAVGDVLKIEKIKGDIKDYPVIIPELKEYHELLLTCKSSDFSVPDYMQFLSDVSRRQMRDMCTIYGIKAEDTLVSCAMTVSYTDTSVILGAVATHPEHRKHGYAGAIVRSLADKFLLEKDVYIYTTIEKNTRFYESLGFFVTGKWIKLLMGDNVE